MSTTIKTTSGKRIIADQSYTEVRWRWLEARLHGRDSFECTRNGVPITVARRNITSVYPT